MHERFETSIYGWTLKFINAEREARYREDRRGLKRMPKQIFVFFAIMVVTIVVLYVIDLLSGFIFDSKYNAVYNFSIWDILAYVSIIPIVAIEFLVYKCKYLTHVRGTLLTAALYLALFYASLSFYNQIIDYPVFGGT